MIDEESYVAGSIVKEVADLAHPMNNVQDLYGRKKVLVIGKDHYDYDNPALPEPTPLKVSTLQAVVDYVQAKIVIEPQQLIVVESETSVKLLNVLVGEQYQTYTYLVATPQLPTIQLGSFLTMEPFLIQLMSAFADTKERNDLQAFCSKLRAGLAKEIEDDGVSQTVTTLSGLTRNEAITVRNPWPLAPYRTFPEIEQPASNFLLRMKQEVVGENLVAGAKLIEADGGAWRPRAIELIGAWLRDKLGPEPVILA